jgi:MFS family permease
VLFGVGFALILVFNLANAVVQSLVPDALRGRVMSIYSLTFFGSLPIGSLLIGWTAARLGEPGTVAVFAGVTLLYAGLLAAVVPQLRRLE